MVVRTFAGAALAILILGATPVHARGSSAFVTQLLGQSPGPGKTFACFARRYPDAHLASHAAQNVAGMEILVTNYGGHQPTYQLRMGFNFKGRTEQLTTVAECGSRDPAGPNGAATCAGPTDGETKLHLEGRNALLVTLPSGIHLWKPGPPDPKHTVNDAFGADDRLFRLDRLPTSRCIDQAFEDEKRLPSRQP